MKVTFGLTQVHLSSEGIQYRGCGHFVKQWLCTLPAISPFDVIISSLFIISTAAIYDCKSPTCEKSSTHPSMCYSKTCLKVRDTRLLVFYLFTDSHSLLGLRSRSSQGQRAQLRGVSPMQASSRPSPTSRLPVLTHDPVNSAFLSS